MFRNELLLRDQRTNSAGMYDSMFHVTVYLINPNRNKLSADAKIASSWFLGVQPSNFFAFSLLAFLFLPNWATISFAAGLNNAKTRTSQLGATLIRFLSSITYL